MNAINNQDYAYDPTEGAALLMGRLLPPEVDNEAMARVFDPPARPARNPRPLPTLPGPSPPETGATRPRISDGETAFYRAYYAGKRRNEARADLYAMGRRLGMGLLIAFGLWLGAFMAGVQ